MTTPLSPVSITDTATTAIKIFARAGISPEVHVRRRRARLARDIAALLGIAPSHVTVADDSARPYGASPGDQITVIDQHDPRHSVFRFIPEITHGGLFYLLGACPDCAEAVPVAEIAVIHDLGRYLASTGHLDEAGIKPGDHASPVPDVFHDDPGHHSLCPVRVGTS